MTLEEIMEHADNLEGLLDLKIVQVRAMKIGSISRERHELAITALRDRVRELRRKASRLRGDEATLELQRVRPGIRPFTHVIVKPEPVRDFAATASKIGPEFR